MKKILCLALTAVASISCSVSKEIRIDFQVTGNASRPLVVVCHTDINDITVDGSGHGSCILTGADAVYARVYYGSDMKRIYAEAGDAATISFDAKDFSGTFLFKGKKAPAVEYLNTVELTALPDSCYALSFGEFLNMTRDKTDEALKLLNAANTAGTGNFRNMEAGRIRYAYANTLLMYPVAHQFMAGDPFYKPDGDYYKTIEGYAQEKPDYADIDEYLEFMSESAHALDPEHRNIKDLYPKLVAEMKYITDNYKDPKVIQALLQHIAVPYIDNFGTENAQDMINIYSAYVTDPVMKESFDAACSKWDLKSAGRMSPDFEAADIEGKTYSLADFKGKYVYIDLWATWCGPCQREMPHLKALEKQFEGKEIVFLGLSVDADKNKWEDKVLSGTLSGIQLYLGNQSGFLTDYEVATIPRFILLDKEGKIVDSDMSRPSSDKTAEFLAALPWID